jgi:hypothetical protein
MEPSGRVGGDGTTEAAGLPGLTDRGHDQARAVAGWLAVQLRAAWRSRPPRVGWRRATETTTATLLSDASRYRPNNRLSP